MSARQPSAYSPLPSLLTSLERAGWGPLAGGQHQALRSVLRALCALLPHRSAQGKATAEQVAASAGLSDKWTRKRLHDLEDLGLIEWHPGGVVQGRPVPGFFRVLKEAVVALIRAARPERDAAVEAHRARTTARLEKLRQLRWLPSPRRKRTVEPLAVQPELSGSLRPLRGTLQESPRRTSLPNRTESKDMPKHSLMARPAPTITNEDLQSLNARRIKAGLPEWQWSPHQTRYMEADAGLPPAPPLHESQAQAAARFINRGQAVPAALAARISRDALASARLLELTGVQL